MTDPRIQPVLEAYADPCRSSRIDYLATAGGLSGAQFWRLETALGRLCLRRWPAEHPGPDQLSAIHRVLQRAVARGFSLLPQPLKTRGGETWVSHRGYLWQLEPWLGGAADWLAAPGEAKLRSAMHVLAQFHRAVADDPQREPQQGLAPGIARRRQQIAWWTGQGLRELGGRLDGLSRPRRAEAQQIAEWFARGSAQVDALLAAGETLSVRLSPCIRDIWHDNVLFVGDEVSGIVDFGAMQTDSVAADIARLLGSLAGDDARAWLAGLDSYQAVRQLTAEEMQLAIALDRANVLLSPLSWMRWLYLDQRTFDNQEQVQVRIDGQLQRLKFMVGKQ